MLLSSFAFNCNLRHYAPDSHNLLRPETVESLMVLWRVTGEAEWRDAGWLMWQAWEKHARWG